ncbi:MAG: sulfate transporter [Rhodobacterales bacterium]|nr:MAG: sulfate transporter [Rhodobacterales bacterium]
MTEQKKEPEFMTNVKGHRVPMNLVKPHDLLTDQVVKDIFNYGKELEAQIARFRAHSYDDLGELMHLLAEEYGIHQRGMREGGRGNVSFKSYDGLKKVEISIQDYMEYGPELQIAKQLIDQFIHERSENLDADVRALLEHAFDVDQQGKINNAALYSLRRLDIQHPLWLQAMEAIKNSQRVESTRQFLRISSRPNPQAKFKSVQINLANAGTEQ